MNQDKKFLGLALFAAKKMKRSRIDSIRELGNEMFPKLLEIWDWMGYGRMEIPNRWYELAEMSSTLERAE